jgi:DNA primase small subunit
MREINNLKQVNKQMEVDENNLAEKIKPAPLKASSGAIELDFNVDLLKIYYDKAFPYDLMYKWLSYFKLSDPNQTGMLKSLKDEEGGAVKSE